MSEIKAKQIEVSVISQPGVSHIQVYVLDDKGRVWLKEVQTVAGQTKITEWGRVLLPEEPTDE